MFPVSYTHLIEQMHLGTDGAYHCILVMGQGHRDGILVESEGFAYARYAAYVPDARALAYPTLERFNQQLIDLVNQIIEDGLENEKEGEMCIRDSSAGSWVGAE